MTRNERSAHQAMRDTLKNAPHLGKVKRLTPLRRHRKISVWAALFSVMYFGCCAALVVLVIWISLNKG